MPGIHYKIHQDPVLMELVIVETVKHIIGKENYNVSQIS